MMKRHIASRIESQISKKWKNTNVVLNQVRPIDINDVKITALNDKVFGRLCIAGNFALTTRKRRLPGFKIADFTKSFSNVHFYKKYLNLFTQITVEKEFKPLLEAVVGVCEIRCFLFIFGVHLFDPKVCRLFLRVRQNKVEIVTLVPTVRNLIDFTEVKQQFADLLDNTQPTESGAAEFLNSVTVSCRSEKTQTKWTFALPVIPYAESPETLLVRYENSLKPVVDNFVEEDGYP